MEILKALKQLGSDSQTISDFKLLYTEKEFSLIFGFPYIFIPDPL
jgi:hypothetical protein